MSLICPFFVTFLKRKCPKIYSRREVKYYLKTIFNYSPFVLFKGENMYGSNQYMLDSLNRQKERIDDMIKNYQNIPQTPVNNFINTGQQPTNLYEIKKLNDGDEVENIAILKDTIFLGDDRMQIKKLDGTIEKYDIKKVYPRDKKDDKIDELTKKIEELEMRLDESRADNESNEATKSSPEQGQDDRLNAKSKSKATSK